jgi:hypothetical protein
MSLEVTATEMQFLGRRDDSEHPASANAGLGQTEEAEEVAKPAPIGSGKSGKKASKRATKEPVPVEEAIGIEEDGMPF